MSSESSNPGSTPPRPPPPLCPLLQDGEDYDAWVLAGGRLFRAHGSVLASHSAYLRAAVGAGGGGPGDGGEARLLLPHVPPAGFAAVLAYMYTGRLPLSHTTLYEVLLAGHLLQMPGVVSLCQALLTTTTAAAATSTTTSASLDLPEVPPALNVWRGLARLVPPHQHSSTLSPTIVRPTPTRPRPLHHQLDPHQDVHREPESMEDRGGQGVDERHSRKEGSDGEAVLNGTVTYSQESDVSTSGRVHSGAVILDVAACDGPVFFERVINRAYKANPLLSQDDSETETEINVDEIDSCDDMAGPAMDSARVLPGGGGTAGTPSETENNNSVLNEIRLTGLAKMQRSLVAAVTPPTPNNQVCRSYHCVYCNHTFKSHYCYQKHMRRHINPITVEVDKLRALNAPGNSTTLDRGGSRARKECSSEAGDGESPAISDSIRRQTNNVSPFSTSSTVSSAPSEGLKILDLNVQYFPCKTCGSKFPSYYFVHKHRRLCHQEEEKSSPLNGKTTKPNGTNGIPTTQSPPPPPPPSAVPLANTPNTTMAA